MKKSFLFRLDEEILNKVRILAALEKRSISSILQEATKAYIPILDKKHMDKFSPERP